MRRRQHERCFGLIRPAREAGHLLGRQRLSVKDDGDRVSGVRHASEDVDPGGSDGGWASPDPRSPLRAVACLHRWRAEDTAPSSGATELTIDAPPFSTLILVVTVPPGLRLLGVFVAAQRRHVEVSEGPHQLLAARVGRVWWSPDGSCNRPLQSTRPPNAVLSNVCSRAGRAPLTGSVS
jgi:hypothetical protein